MFTYVELFAGIGGFRSALDEQGGVCVFASEIDKYAQASYRALYNGAPELHGDITKIEADDIPDADLLVGGFPCQSFSVAGRREGFEDTRGTLFFEIARIASRKQPRWMLLENVKGLLSHDGGRTFETMAAILNDIGYGIDFHVLNSKYFGVPQNRERLFILCSRDTAHQEWDIYGSGGVARAKRRIADMGVRTFNFGWPKHSKVTTRLRDVLERQVAERYYISDEKTASLLRSLNGHKSEFEDVVCINPRKEDGTQTYQQDRIYEADGVMTTLSADLGRYNVPDLMLTDVGVSRKIVIRKDITPPLRVGGGGDIPGIWIQEAAVNDRGELKTNPDDISNAIDANYFKCMDQHGQRTHVVESPIMVGSLEHYGNDQMNRVYSVEGVAPTITVKSGGGREQKIAEPDFPFRIRKLTPKECWRLQGFTDGQHDAVFAAGLSDTQRYKQAGNAVTVNVIRAIGDGFIPLLTRNGEMTT